MTSSSIWHRFETHSIISNEHKQIYDPDVVFCLDSGNVVAAMLHMYNEDNHSHVNELVHFKIESMVPRTLEESPIKPPVFTAKIHMIPPNYDLEHNTCDINLRNREFQIDSARHIVGIPVNVPENNNISDLLRFYTDGAYYDSESSDSESESDSEDESEAESESEAEAESESKSGSEAEAKPARG